MHGQNHIKFDDIMFQVHTQGDQKMHVNQRTLTGTLCHLSR